MKLVFATHNVHKLEELRQLLANQIELISLDDIGCWEAIPETSDTLEGNASLKSAYVYENYGYNCFADDTGLEVEALGRAPGVYSARYAGEEKDTQANCRKLLRELAGSSDRQARFRTVFSLIIAGKETLLEGQIDGEILREGKGKDGFGYDPVFSPDGDQRSFGEMTLSEKGKISHRGKAVQKLVSHLMQLKDLDS